MSLEAKLQIATAHKIPSVLSNYDSIDAWRHMRMYQTLRPIINAYSKQCSWLTIGDGGADAWAVQLMDAEGEITASSIASERLDQLKESGRLPKIKIKALNAEHIDLPDKSVDFILCKEAYHHFPHPHLALYEFMRVARKGIVFIEPAVQLGRPLDVLRSLAKRVIRKRDPIYEMFEPVGNYIYRLSPHEIERTLMALQTISWYAYKTFSDFGTPKIVGKSRYDTKAKLLFLAGVKTQEWLAAMRLMSPGFYTLFIPLEPHLFMEPLEYLAKYGFKIRNLPRNPYRAEDYLKAFVS